jgi:hypothetical protein
MLAYLVELIIKFDDFIFFLRISNLRISNPKKNFAILKKSPLLYIFVQYLATLQLCPLFKFVTHTTRIHKT